MPGHRLRVGYQGDGVEITGARAECSCPWRGKWRQDPEQPYRDASDHLSRVQEQRLRRASRAAVGRRA